MASLQVLPELVLRCGALEASLSPSAGGRTIALRTTGAAAVPCVDWLVPLAAEVRADGFASTAWPKAGCYPLAPFSNRIRAGHFSWNGRSVRLPLHPGEPHALHGASHRMPWALVQHDACSATMELLHGAGDAGWPWAFAASQRVVLDAGGLTLHLRIRNASDEAMPCGMGFHPFIPARFGHRIRFDAESVWPPDGEYLPADSQPVEDVDDYSTPRALEARSFTQYYAGFQGVVELASEEGHVIRIETDEALRHLVLYRPPPSAGAYICVEPVSHVTDAANLAQRGMGDTGWHSLAAGAAWACRMRLHLDPGRHCTPDLRTMAG